MTGKEGNKESHENLTARERDELNEDYRAKEKQLMGSVKKDKIEFLESLAREAECTAGRQNTRSLYQISKRIC